MAAGYYHCVRFFILLVICIGLTACGGGGGSSDSKPDTNVVPVADGQNIVLDPDTVADITLTGSDADDDPLLYTLVDLPEHGSLSGDAPLLIYTPDAGYTGADSFTFIVNDGTADSAVATIQLAINAASTNTPPVANAQNLSADEGQPLGITLTGSDGDGDSLVYLIRTLPEHGNLDGVAPNLVYTPDAGFTGVDTFSFSVSDGVDDAAPAMVNITVNKVNTAPVANEQSLVTQEDTALIVTLTGSDVDNDTLIYAIATQPDHGELSGAVPDLVYTPSSGFSGTDGFTFVVSDGRQMSAPATVSITVQTVNAIPVAEAQNLSVLQGQALSIILSGSDADGDMLTYAIVAQPGNGVLSGTAPNLVYTANTGFSGMDSFFFTVNDGTDESNQATISITVNDPGSAPVVSHQNVWTNIDTALPITLTASDADGDDLTYTVITSPENGTLSGMAPALVYMPNAGFSGDDRFQFRVSDGIFSVSRFINISVSQPQFSIGGTVTGMKDAGLVLANNGGDSLSVTGSNFVFETLLTTGSAYHVTLESEPDKQLCRLKNANGNVAEADVDNISVTCHAWQSVESLYAGSTLNNQSQISMDNEGNAMAVWRNGAYVLASYYSSASKTWESAKYINHGAGGATYTPQIAFDGAGNAMAVWGEYNRDTGEPNIWVNQYSAADNTWGTAEKIQTLDGSATEPGIAVNQSGDAMVIWMQAGAAAGIYANHYSGGSWSGGVLISESSSGSMAQLSISSSGDVVVVWEQGDDFGGRDIWVKRYADGIWSSAQVIDATDGNYYSTTPQIVSDEAGNSIAVWSQYSRTPDGNYQIWVSRYSVVMHSWGAPQSISGGLSNDKVPQIAMDADGNAVAVWTAAYNDNTQYRTMSSRYSKGDDTWSAPDSLAYDDNGDRVPQVAVDGYGNAVVVWERTGTTVNSIWSNRYSAINGAWGTPEQISDDGWGGASPKVSFDASGTGAAVWGIRYESNNFTQVNNFR